MPVSRSGEMLDVYSVPNGVGIGRPPANSAPPGFVWQAMQSPARARYSPLAINAASSARAAAARQASSQHARSVGTQVLRQLRITPSQFGSLPQVSGIGSVPCATGDGSAGTG